MLDTLIESRSRKARSFAGTATSVAAHTALIAVAVYATAQAHVSPPAPPTAVRPIYFPSSTIPASVRRSAPSAKTPVTGARPVYVPPVKVDISLPTVDVSSMASRPTDFTPSTTLASASGSSGSSTTDSSGTPFSADQVERQVALSPGALPPKYPEALRNAGIEGQVMATFVVDESGRAEASSVRFLRSDNQLFEDAVRVALGRMRFSPAEIGGRKVRQLVQMPFVFTIQK
jgi:periplasmic protein TonB